MAKHIENFKSWSETIVSDVAALEKLVESSKAEGEARRLAAGALSYLVTRLDLVPDHEAGIGALDDVMVLRVCAQLASGHGESGVDDESEITLARMANEADQISDFLGKQAYDKLRQYCTKLADTTVRGRTPGQIIADEAVRKALYEDVDAEIKKTVPVIIKDAEDAELRLKAYLSHKLK
ncbi:MAG TPA: YkvA family protein [Kofleriaceae bacterium]|nr:YkvA family protein [Kofleriaceae bacterium]